MKKILISLAALSLILTACGGEGKIEKKVVKEFGQFAKDNEYEFLLSYVRDKEQIEVSNEYYKHFSQEELSYSYIAEYSLYNNKGEAMFYLTIEEHNNKISEDELAFDSCIIDKTLLTYIDGYDVEFKDSEESLETFKKTCGKLDGKYIEEVPFEYDFEEDEWE